MKLNKIITDKEFVENQKLYRIFTFEYDLAIFRKTFLHKIKVWSSFSYEFTSLYSIQTSKLIYYWQNLESLFG